MTSFVPRKIAEEMAARNPSKGNSNKTINITVKAADFKFNADLAKRIYLSAIKRM